MTIRNNYRDFTEQDFINDAYFQDWIIQPNPEKDSFWHQFLMTYPDKKEVVENAVKTLKAIGFKEVWPANEKVEAGLNQALYKINASSKGKVKALQFFNVMWMRRAGWAAAVLVLLVTGVFVWRTQSDKKVATTNTKPQPVQNDIMPGGNKAVLTLADGSKVILDTANNGALAKQGNATIIKLDGQLAYNKGGEVSKEVLYNTISTPKGGQYQLILADGTKVWLNAASSLRFPTSFPGKERKLELKGEGYFEVAKEAGKPFIVNVDGGSAIEVLGTQFNVNAYSNENSITTTLLEGAIKISGNAGTALMKPGQQVKIMQQHLSISDNVDIDKAMAWKNGLFNFENASLQEVMRQLERWYDIEVVYEGEVPNIKFGGQMSRNIKLAGLLKVLQASKVHFRVESDDRKLIVMP